MEERQSFQQMVLEQLHIMQKKKKRNPETDHRPFNNTNSEWITDKYETQKKKLIENNIWENLDDLWHGDNFLDTTSRYDPWEKELWWGGFYQN